MKKRIRTIIWLPLAVLAVVYGLADIIRDTSTIGGAYLFVKDWITGEYGYERVKDDDLTILIIEFERDKEGKHTRELEKGLLQQGWHSVRVRTTIGIEREVDHSRPRLTREQSAVREFAEKYGGDLVVSGEVGIQEGKAEIRIFSPRGELIDQADVDLTGSWRREVLPSLEVAVLNRLVETSKGEASERTHEMLRRNVSVELKTAELLKLIEDKAIKEEARTLLRKLSMRIGAATGDVARLRAVRLELEDRLSREREQITRREKFALVGTVANLRQEEGLITDDGKLLNSSFVWSHKARDVMGFEDEGTKYTDDLIGNEMVDMLLEFESAVALACRDRKRIAELLAIFGRAAGCRTDALDSRCAGWATRAIFALRYGSIAWDKDGSRRAAAAYTVSGMATIEYGGAGAGYKWMDPMVQAENLLRESLGVEHESPIPGWESSGAVPKVVGIQQRCPDLIRLIVLQ